MKQTQTYYPAKLKGISISKNGHVINTKTQKPLKVSKRGYFMINQKPINLPKLMLNTFRNIPIKPGRIVFLDGDKKNYFIENIEYVTKIGKIKPPTETELKTVLSFYFKLDQNFKIRDYIQFRMYLSMILEQRGFFTENKKLPNIHIFKDYISVNMPNFINLSKRNNISVLDAKRTVYFFLNKLIEDCKNDEDLKRLKT